MDEKSNPLSEDINRNLPLGCDDESLFSTIAWKSQQIDVLHLEGCEKHAKHQTVMNRFLLQRLCVAIMVLSFIVGLPMQGTALAFSTKASSAPWAEDAETSTSDACDGCGTLPAMSTLCPTVFCVGLTGVVSETSAFERQMPNTHLLLIPISSVGLSITPDPYPPRFST